MTQQNPGISTTSAAKFTAIATSAYCPQHLHRASDNGASPSPPPGTGWEYRAVSNRSTAAGGQL